MEVLAIIRVCAAAAATAITVAYHAAGSATDGMQVTRIATCIKGQSQSSTQPPAAILVPASTPPMTPQPLPATSPCARPPVASSPSPLPSPPPTSLPTAGHPSTARPLDTGYGPCARNVIVDSEQDATISTTKTATAKVHTDDGGKGFGTRSDVESPPSPPRTSSSTPAKEQLREEATEACSV